MLGRRSLVLFASAATWAALLPAADRPPAEVR